VFLAHQGEGGQYKARHGQGGDVRWRRRRAGYGGTATSWAARR
jgi:hypothetical protein